MMQESENEAIDGKSLPQPISRMNGRAGDFSVFAFFETDLHQNRRL